MGIRYFCLLLIVCITVSIPRANAGNEGTIALVMKALSNPFFFQMENGARTFAMEEGIPLEVFGVERETDVERQIGICEDLISRGYGAIVIAPADSKKLVPVCKKAVDKGIIVVNIDNPLHRETMSSFHVSVPFVGSDNRLGAALVGEYVKEELKGRGQVIVIEGIRGVENAELRKKGFIEAVTRDSRIDIVRTESANWHTDEALSVTNRLLALYPQINAIFCANDKMALGALQALEITGLVGNVLLAGYDNIESVRDEMRTSRIHATIEQHPELMGRYGVELAWKALNGESIPSYRSTPLDLITHDTFNKTIAMSVSDLSSVFFGTLLTSARKTAELNGMQLVLRDARNSESRQLADIVDLLSGNIDLLVVNPTNTEAVMPAIEMANQKQIPVITVDRKASGGKILCHIESDNVEGGRMAGRLLAERFQGRGARVVEIEGIPGTSAAHERGIGFNQVIQNHANIRVVAREVANFDRREAGEVMRRVLDEVDTIDAVFAHNDVMILGAMDVLETDVLENDKTRRRPVLIGFDGVREARQAVRQGRLAFTIVQKPDVMGKLSVEAAVRHFRGEAIPGNVFVDLAVFGK